MYVSEVAPSEQRGRFSVLFQLSIALGSFLAACVAGLQDIKTLGTTGLLMLNVLFSSIQFIGMLIMPESPRWLILQGKYIQARGVTLWIQESSTDGLKKLVHSIRTEGRRYLRE